MAQKFIFFGREEAAGDQIPGGFTAPGFGPGGVPMGGCCMCKKWLKLLAGLVLILISLKYLALDPWLVIGVLFVLIGLMPMLCKCDECEVKKKK
jgi:hypothetical protein